MTYPANATFAAGGSGWTDTDTCSVLCSVSTTFAAGSPSGTATTTYHATLGLTGTNTGTATLTSSDFAWSGPAPLDATIALGREATLSNNLSLQPTATWSVSLDNVTTTTTTVLESGSITASDSGFVTLQAPVSPSLFEDGDEYSIVVDLSFSSVVALAETATVAFDEVSLTADQSPGSGATGGSTTGASGATGPTATPGSNGDGNGDGSGSTASGSTGSGSGGAGTSLTGVTAGPSTTGSADPAACKVVYRRVSRPKLETCMEGGTLRVLVAFPWRAGTLRVAISGAGALIHSRRGHAVGSIATGPSPTVISGINVQRHGGLALHGRTGFRLARHNRWLVITHLARSARYARLILRFATPPSKPIAVRATVTRAQHRASPNASTPRGRNRHAA